MKTSLRANDTGVAAETLFWGHGSSGDIPLETLRGLALRTHPRNRQPVTKTLPLPGPGRRG